MRKIDRVLIIVGVALCFARPHLSSCTKKNLTIPALVPMFTSDRDRWACRTAMAFAFDLINNRSDILKDYNLVGEFYDTVASVPKALYQMSFIINQDKCKARKKPPVVLGPAFSDTAIAVAEALYFYYTLQYTFGATSPKLDNANKFPYLVRTLSGTSAFSDGHVALMKHFGWKRAGIFYDHQSNDGIFIQITENLIKKFRSNNLTIVRAESADGSAPTVATSDGEIRERLEKLKVADVRIIFAQFTLQEAYRIFCQVYKLGMYGESYVWLVHPRVETVDKWLQPPKHAKMKTDCTEQQHREVSDRMFFFEQQYFREDSVRTISNLTASEYVEYIQAHRLKHPHESMFVNSTMHAYAFDTVWSAALTLDKAIGELEDNNITLDNMSCDRVQASILKKYAYKVEFEGITGPVRLDASQGRRGTLTLFQIRGSSVVKIGRFEAMTGKLILYREATKDLWKGGRIPKDRSLRRTVLKNIPYALYIPLVTVAGLGVILALGVLLFNIYYRNERHIRKSAPLFNNMIICGIIMCLSTVAFFGFPVRLGETEKYLMTCKLRKWILCLGFSLSFGSMFVKTWRVYKIFTNRKLRYSIERLSNTSLLGMVTMIVAIDILILLLWRYLDPMQVRQNSLPKEVDADDPTTIILPVVYSCYSDNQGKWVTAIYVWKGILLLYGLFLAYETRNVQFEHLNDSRMIGMCVYNVAVMSLLGGLLRIMLTETYYREIFGITAICIIFPSLGTLILIFLPKVVRFVKSTAHTGETEGSEGVVIEGPGARNGNNFDLRKDSVCSEGLTSISSSIPCSNSRIMPIYEEAGASPNGKNHSNESPA